jgi:hypothetical protein
MAYVQIYSPAPRCPTSRRTLLLRSDKVSCSRLRLPVPVYSASFSPTPCCPPSPSPPLTFPHRGARACVLSSFVSAVWFCGAVVMMRVRVCVRALSSVVVRTRGCRYCRLVPWCRYRDVRTLFLLSSFVPADIVIVVVVEVVGKEEAEKVRRGCSTTFQVNDFGSP